MRLKKKKVLFKALFSVIFRNPYVMRFGCKEDVIRAYFLGKPLGKSEYSGEVIKNTRDDEMTRFWDSAGNQSRRAFEN